MQYFMFFFKFYHMSPSFKMLTGIYTVVVCCFLIWHMGKVAVSQVSIKSQSIAGIWLAAFCKSLPQDISIGHRVLQNFGTMFQ